MTGRVHDVLRDAILRAAEEAEHLRDGLQRLDHALGQAAESLPVPALHALQQADLVRQEADGLATFLSRLAEGTPTTIEWDAAHALAGLTLGAQADRLGGAAAPARRDHTAQPCGSTEMWETWGTPSLERRG